MLADTAELQRLETLRRGDSDALAGCLADGFVYIHGNGRIDRKTDYVEAIASGDLRYQSIDIENMTTSVGDGYSNVLYDFHAVRTRGDAAPVQFYRRVLAVWIPASTRPPSKQPVHDPHRRLKHDARKSKSGAAPLNGPGALHGPACELAWNTSYTVGGRRPWGG